MKTILKIKNEVLILFDSFIIDVFFTCYIPNLSSHYLSPNFLRNFLNKYKIFFSTSFKVTFHKVTLK